MHRILVTLLLWACALVASAAEPQSLKAYHGNTGHPDAWSGGVRMIPIHTPKGEFRVWTKRVGNNPTGMTSEWKKAVVKLSKNSKNIEIFEGMV